MVEQNFDGFEVIEEEELTGLTKRVAAVGENFYYMVYNIVDTFAYTVGLSTDPPVTEPYAPI